MTQTIRSIFTSNSEIGSGNPAVIRIFLYSDFGRFT